MKGLHGCQRKQAISSATGLKTFDQKRFLRTRRKIKSNEREEVIRAAKSL